MDSANRNGLEGEFLALFEEIHLEEITCRS